MTRALKGLDRYAQKDHFGPMNSYKTKDHYSKKATKEGFKARSVYKLEEIHKKYRIFKKGNLVLDLGYFPGSWSQYASNQVGPSGKILGLDIQRSKNLNLKNGIFLEMSIFDLELEKLPFREFNVLLSDMAPNTTGVKITDQARSLALCERAFEMACSNLMVGGHFVTKIFEGASLKEFKEKVRKEFKEVRLLKPKGTRSNSKEIYVIGLEKNFVRYKKEFLH